MDLRDLWRPGGGRSQLTWRRARVLVRGLRPDSATRIAIDGPDTLWGLTNTQLADLFDVLAQANWQRANSGVPKHKQSRQPKPYRRPGDRAAATHMAPERIRRREAARARAAERRRLIAEGVIT